MKEQEKDNLRSLFQDMELSNLPEGFENRLMQQIHLIDTKKEKQKALKQKIYITISIVLGIAGMVALPLLIFYFITGNIGFDLPSVEFNYSLFPRFSKMDINPLVVLLPSVILLLVMGDTLIRKHISDKKHHDI